MKKEELHGRDWLESEKRQRRDRIIAYAGLAVLGAPASAARAAKYMEDRRPVLFMQGRVGQGGELFPMYKLRTMDDIDSQQSSPNEITPVGNMIRKLKLDEVPQFYNVLRGEMSIVGPRPLMPFSFEYMKAMLPRGKYEEWTDTYCSARPGIVSDDSMFSHLRDRDGVDPKWRCWMRAEQDIHMVENATPENDKRIMVVSGLVHTLGRLSVEGQEPAY